MNFLGSVKMESNSRETGGDDRQKSSGRKVPVSAELPHLSHPAGGLTGKNGAGPINENTQYRDFKRSTMRKEKK
jgi:hypothetical protein